MSGASMVKPPDVLAPALKVNDRIVGCMPGMSRCGRLCAIRHGVDSEIPHASLQITNNSFRISHSMKTCQSDMPQPPIALRGNSCEKRIGWGKNDDAFGGHVPARSVAKGLARCRRDPIADVRCVSLRRVSNEGSKWTTMRSRAEHSRNKRDRRINPDNSKR